MGIEFIKDCLGNRLGLKEISEKYGIDRDKVYDVYMEERKTYTVNELHQIIREVYYEVGEEV